MLDDHSAFDRATEVVNSFDGLIEIHQELETARKKQQSLQPIAMNWAKYQQQQQHLTGRQTLESLLPIWFAQQVIQLWREKVSRLDVEIGAAETREEQIQSQLELQKKVVADCVQRYYQAGGVNIDKLNERINDWQKTSYQTRNSGAPVSATDPQS